MSTKKTEQEDRRKRFGVLLTRERNADGLTQEVVAERRGHHKSLTSACERGERDMTVARVGDGGPHEVRALACYALESLSAEDVMAVLESFFSGYRLELPAGMRLVLLEDVRELVEDEKARARTTLLISANRVRAS